MTGNNFNVWQESFIESFLEINSQSNIKSDWLNYSEILKTEYKDCIIKPINKYFYKLSIPPKLVSIENNKITLCQENFAEIFLLKRQDSLKLTAMEKIHMRQFYLSNKINKEYDLLFDEVYRWAMPWNIDYEGIEINIEPVQDSPYYFYPISYVSSKMQGKIIDTKMLFFQFKNKGQHMVDLEYGRIKRNNPAYFINFTVNDTMVEEIKEFYGKY